MSVRLQRLQNDRLRLEKLCEESDGRLTLLRTRGNPPDTFEVRIQCRSIERLAPHAEPVYREEHRLQVGLPPNYPGLFARPWAKMLTPIYHPHIFPSGVVCVGDEHMPSEFLDLFVLRMAEVLRYNPQLLDLRSPAHHEALRWAQAHMHLFPTDPHSFLAPTETPKPKIGWNDAP
jgi:ubiquitin-protein ligase